MKQFRDDLKKKWLRSKQPENLLPFEKRVYSQNGEDGIIEELFYRIGTDSKFAVEFGVEDGSECNTRLLKEKGWQVLQMDGNDDNPPSIKQEFITAENINKLFAKYKVPKNLDFLCIDIDTNDFWVWKAISENYRPRVVAIEYNASIAPCYAQTVVYDPKLIWDGSTYFGGSLLAMYRLAKRKGYELITCNENGVNAFFVRKDLINAQLKSLNPQHAYRAPGYGILAEDGVWTGHRPSSRKMVNIGPDLEVAKL